MKTRTMAQNKRKCILPVYELTIAKRAYKKKSYLLLFQISQELQLYLNIPTLNNTVINMYNVIPLKKKLQDQKHSK